MARYGVNSFSKYFTYIGNKSREISEISFPIGGIGTGSLGLAGNGRLIDWEIFNRPSKGSVNGFSHFAIKAEHEGKVLMCEF
ncbi:MAG: GH116 family glycosyl-hydrolase [Thermoproteota archaeon]